MPAARCGLSSDGDYLRRVSCDRSLAEGLYLLELRLDL
jgi:hypothetical protein